MYCLLVAFATLDFERQLHTGDDLALRESDQLDRSAPSAHRSRVWSRAKHVLGFW